MPQERERALDGGRGEPALGRGVAGPDLPDRGQTFDRYSPIRAAVISAST